MLFPVGFTMKKLLITLIPCIALADTIVTINQDQLNQAKQELQQSGNNAINGMQQASQTISSIKLNNLNLTPVESEINMAKPLISKSKLLNNKLPDGQKYYLYSESVVSDSKEYLAQFKDGKPLDINQVITDFNDITKNAKNRLGTNRLLIFISSSMPKKSISNLMTQAAPLHAVFVVRGLINGSYVNTYKYFYSLKGDNDVGIMLNPTLFNAMQVDAVPTFALYQSNQDLLSTACKVAPKYTKVSGEVTVRYALSRLQDSENKDLAQIARNEVTILDNSGSFKNRKAQ